MCRAIAYIKNNETGEIRKYSGHFMEYEDKDLAIWVWEEGNFSCDCNRCVFFRRVENEYEDNCECGEGGYSVNLENPETKKIFYREF